jgi:hypothetical protein
MQFYFYKIDEGKIGETWSWGTCLAAFKEKQGLVKILLLEILNKRLWHNVP